MKSLFSQPVVDSKLKFQISWQKLQVPIFYIILFIYLFYFLRKRVSSSLITQGCFRSIQQKILLLYQTPQHIPQDGFSLGICICHFIPVSMATYSAIPQTLLLSFPNHKCSKFFLPSGFPSVSLLHTNRPKASSVAFNGVRSLLKPSDFPKSVATSRLVGFNSKFLQMGSPQACSSREVSVKSSSADNSSTSTLSKNVS